MSDAVFQRSPAVSRIRTTKRAGRLSTGHGLAIGTMASIGLWAGIAWIVARALS